MLFAHHTICQRACLRPFAPLIALMYGIPLEQCAAVGDSENDLPMLEAAGLAIAMGNAPEHVRAAAQRVVDTNAQGGVVQAILSCLEH